MRRPVALLLTVFLAAALLPSVARPAVADGGTVRFEGTTTVDGWTRSRAVVTAPFSLVGFELPLGAVVRTRTANGNGPWSAWTDPLGPDIEHHPDDDGDRGGEPTFSEPVWVREANRVQVEVRGAEVSEVAAHLVPATPGGFRAAAPCEPSLALPDGPTVVSRSTWGAAAPTEDIEHASDVGFGVIHHTDTSNGYAPGEGCEVVRSIQNWHMNGRGWADIGYNLLVDRFGTVYEGRAGGLTNNVIGAHARGSNEGSFGVAVLGDLDAGPVPTAAVDALVDLVSWKFRVHGIDPAADATTTTPSGNVVPTLVGHRDVVATQCPGDAMHDKLPTLRARVAKTTPYDPVPPQVATEGIPIVGDWDGDGLSTPGWFLNGRWFMVNELSETGDVWQFSWGDPAGLPVVGDWDGDGDDTIGFVLGGSGTCATRTRRERRMSSSPSARAATFPSRATGTATVSTNRPFDAATRSGSATT